MVMRETVGPCHIPGADGVDHLFVLVGEEAAVIGLLDIVEVEVQDAAALVEQLLRIEIAHVDRVPLPTARA